MSATLTLNQVGLPPGVANVSRSDGLGTGALVTCSHSGLASFVEFAMLWAPEDDSTAAGSFAQVGNNATFTPDSSSIGGTYRIRLRVTDATGTSEQIRLFAIRTAGGLRIPALNERADERASLENNGAAMISASEFNEPSDAGPFQGGNYGGWYATYSDLVRKVESLSGGGGGGVLYSVDFANLANQSLVNGANVIDGKTWWLKGALGAGETAAVVNGAGLRIDVQQDQTLFAYSTGDITQGFQLYLDFAGQFPTTYIPTKPLVVQYRFEDISLAHTENVKAVVSLFSCPQSTARPTAAQRIGLNGFPLESTPDWRFQTSYPGSSLTSFNNVDATGTVLNEFVCAISQPSIFGQEAFAVTSVGDDTTWPTVSSAPDFVRVFDGMPLGGSPSPNMGFCFWYENHIGAPFGLHQFTLRSIRIFQLT